MPAWFSVFFPRYLSRLPYVFLLVPLEVTIIATVSMMDDSYGANAVGPLPGLVCLLATIYLVFVVMLARVRDIGWHPASILIGLIPVVGGAYGLALLLKPSIGRETIESNVSLPTDSVAPRG